MILLAFFDLLIKDNFKSITIFTKKMTQYIQWFSYRQISGSHRLMALMVFAFGFIYLFYGEIVPAGSGFGWDGVTYANMTHNLPSMISEGQLSNYYSRRILPSIIVRFMLMTANVPFTNENIISFFQLYHLILMVGMVYLWKRVADNFSLSLNGRWLGFLSLFVNFLFSKCVWYAPLVTDVTALFFSLSLLLFYVEKKPIALFITTILGSFAWQIINIYGALLLVFMYSSFSQEAVVAKLSLTSIKSEVMYRFARFAWIALLFLSIICFGLLKYFHDLLTTRIAADDTVFSILDKLEQFITGVPSLIVVLVGILMLIGSKQFFFESITQLKNIRFPVFILAIAALVIPVIIARIISNPEVPNPSGFLTVLMFVFCPPHGEGKFLLPLVALTLLWGPAVLLVIIYWQEVCIECRKLGLGAISVVGISLPLCLPTEERFPLAAWPFVVLALILVMEKKPKSLTFNYIFILLTIGYAQFWLKINLAPWIGSDYDGLLEFPKQILFMHTGPWMSWNSYFLQLPIVILSGLLLYKLIFTSK